MFCRKNRQIFLSEQELNENIVCLKRKTFFGLTAEYVRIAFSLCHRSDQELFHDSDCDVELFSSYDVKVFLVLSETIVRERGQCTLSKSKTCIQ